MRKRPQEKEMPPYTHDVVDGNVNEFDKVANEAHDDKAHADCAANLDVLCEQKGTRQRIELSASELIPKYGLEGVGLTLLVWLGTPVHELPDTLQSECMSVFPSELKLELEPARSVLLPIGPVYAPVYPP